MVQCQLYQYVWFGEFRRFVLQVLVCHTPPFARHSGDVEAPTSGYNFIKMRPQLTSTQPC